MELLDEVKDALFYRHEGKTYLIFSKTYPNIGEVKILFDTTPYIKSQIIIVKISILLIVIFSILIYFL
jgi:hypothetical protein